MKVFTFGCLLALALSLRADFASAAVPKEVRQELDQIFDSVTKTPFFGLSDEDAAAKYWHSLNRLGHLVSAELYGQLVSELKPAEAEMLAIAASYRQRREQIDELSLWYGRFSYDVPFDLKKKRLSATKWEQMEKAGIAKVVPSGTAQQINSVVPLHDEHAVEAYRHAWEAWFLAPSTKEKVRLLPRAHQAISRVANPLSLPLLVESFKDAVRDRDMRDDPPKRDTQAWAIIYTIHSFKSEAALVALLECREEALKAGVGPGSAIYFAQDKSFDESFIRLMTSTRHDPEAPPFNEGWKAYLPHVETQLARGDLPAAHRMILNQIATPLRARQGR